MDKIKHILNTVIGQIASNQTLPPDKIQRVWASVLSVKALSHTRVVDFKEGVLLVFVDTPAWLYQLKTQKTDLVNRLKSEIPEFKQLVLKIGKVV